MATNQVNLYELFQTVNQALQQNQDQLNNADTYNHDHGNNMVDVFSTIAKAMLENKNATPAEQLSSAASQLRTKQSGSAQYYEKSLNQAATELGNAKGITAANAITLIQALLGGGEAKTQAGNTTGDMLGSLLTSLTGATGTSSTSGTGESTIDWATVAAAGMQYMQDKQAGKDTLTSLMDALMADAPTKSATYRKDSGSIVTNTLLQALGSMLSKSS
jgi:alpha-D-ribose 1-methylphosphonate 5-triphosphate synthase subunit PhnG